MVSARVTSKGQITIPIEVRKELGLSPGDELMFFKLGNGEFALRPRNGSIRDLEGIVPKLDFVPTLEQLKEGVAAAIQDEYAASVSRDAKNAPEDEAA